MFCPKCRTEYRDGFDICADCHVPLVAKLEAEPELEFIEYDEVLSTFNTGDIALVKTILDSADIVYFFQGENFAYVRPLIEPARLLVKIDQVEVAKEMIKDLDLNYAGINLPDDPDQSQSDAD